MSWPKVKGTELAWRVGTDGGTAPPELMFLETSALTGENVEEAFLKCARTILNKIDSGEAHLLSERWGSRAKGRVLWAPRNMSGLSPPTGELDPERMGSGIQYGDISLRQLRQPRSAQAVAPQPCGC